MCLGNTLRPFLHPRKSKLCKDQGCKIVNLVFAKFKGRTGEKGLKGVVDFLGMSPMDLSNEISSPSLALFYASQEFNANA